jgi:hypothetical protein
MTCKSRPALATGDRHGGKLSALLVCSELARLTGRKSTLSWGHGWVCRLLASFLLCLWRACYLFKSLFTAADADDGGITDIEFLLFLRFDTFTFKPLPLE